MNCNNPTSTGSTRERACGKTHMDRCGAVMRIIDARLHTSECFLPVVLPRMAENFGVGTKKKKPCWYECRPFFVITGLKSKMNHPKVNSSRGKTRADGNTGGRHQSRLHLPSRPYEAVDAVRTSAMWAKVTENKKQQQKHRERREVRIVCQQKETPEKEAG